MKGEEGKSFKSAFVGLREATLELAVIVPTYNECDNVRPLVAALDMALHGIVWEVLFVDDSSLDGTADVPPCG